MKTQGKLYLLAGIVLFTLLFVGASAQATSLAAVNAAILFDATHEVVCECDCGGETQTYEWFPNFACSRYDDIKCDYGNGSQSTLSGCEKKAQPKDASATPIGQKLSAPGVSVSVGGVVVGPALPYQPYPVDVIDFDIPTGDEYVAWLDGISNNLFGTTFPGLVLDDTPNVSGTSYTGFTGVGLLPFSLDVTKIDQQQIELNYVDPDTFFVADLEIVWLRGTLSNGTASEYVEGLAITATQVGQPANELTIFTPYNTMYPYTTAKALLAGFDAEQIDDLFVGFSKIEAQQISRDEGDPCQACKDDGNKKIKRMKRDLKSCLKWKGGAATVVGGLVGFLGGGVGAIGGAIAGGGLASGYCADKALDTYGDIIEDFCACFAANDCGEHEKCTEE